MSESLPEVGQAALLAEGLSSFIEQDARRHGGPGLKDPGRRTKLVWPPHSVSHEFGLGSSDFTDESTVGGYGEVFRVSVAETPHGVFGRCETLWNDARGDTRDEMLANLRLGMEPMLQRRHMIAQTLGMKGLMHFPLKHLGHLDLLKLLYCPDRDVAMEARTIIETQASSRLFLPSLLAVLHDKVHPLRRSPQWCVLDMFEDLPAFAKSEEESEMAVLAMRDLMWDSDDDYCRTIYKAGVVLGGHICTDQAAEALLELVKAPSRIARRSASHAVFHLVEWRPEHRETVVAAMQVMAREDSEPLLREFASHMADDIASGANDHVPEPVFADEEA